jgi:hypothetical protein
MPKKCAIIVITSMAELKSHGNAHMINSMLAVCVKIAILMIITKSGG